MHLNQSYISEALETGLHYLANSTYNKLVYEQAAIIYKQTYVGRRLVLLLYALEKSALLTQDELWSICACIYKQSKNPITTLELSEEQACGCCEETPAPPVLLIDAGEDQTLTMPTSSTNLSGRAEGNSVTVLWENVSGPTSVQISNVTSLNTTVTGMILAGVYVFKLTGKDGFGTASDTMEIRVIIPGLSVTVNADKTINLPTNSVTGLATAIGIDITYQWTQVSGPSQATIQTPTSMSTVFSNLVEGVYVFKVTVTDAFNQTASAQFSTTVVQTEKIKVNAGVDKAIKLPVTSAQLSGSITCPHPYTFIWTQVSGPSTALIGNPTTSLTPVISNLIAGTYVFKLKGTDSINQDMAEDLANITVAVADMTVNAGTYNDLTLPVNSRMLSGTVTGSGVTVLWTKVTGPAVVISNATSLQPTLSDMVAGTYTFRLTGTDQFGQVKSSTTTFSVVAVTAQFTAWWGWSPNFFAENLPRSFEEMMPQIGRVPDQIWTQRFQFKGQPIADEIFSVNMHDRTIAYTAVSTDTVETVIGALVARLNAFGYTARVGGLDILEIDQEYEHAATLVYSYAAGVPTDPFTFNYQGSGQFSQGAKIVADYRQADMDNYLILKLPVSEWPKTKWENGPFNFGEIPDSVWLPGRIVGGFVYLISRRKVTFAKDAKTEFS